MTPLKKAIFVCVDCETTGLNPKEDKIIEVGVIRFTLEEILEEFESLVDPESEIPAASLEIHHINASMLKDKPKIKEVLPSVFRTMNNRIIVGHGIGFDLEVLDVAAKKNGIIHDMFKRPFIDTLRLARHYGDSPNNSLGQLARHFNVEIEGVPHRAMTDVKMNIAVFKQLVRRFQTVEELYNILSRPIKMKYMPLGKYKGRLMSEIPFPYLEWASRLNFDGDLLYTIQQEIKKRKKGGQFSQSTNPFNQL